MQPVVLQRGPLLVIPHGLNTRPKRGETVETPSKRCIWPDRVVKEKCTTDRSIAIAHDLEEQLWHEVTIEKTSKTGKVTTKTEWQPRKLTDRQLNDIIQEVKQRPYSSS